MTPGGHGGTVLITPDSPWPPPGPQAMRDRWRSWGAWWSGDLKALRCDTPLTAPHGYWSRRNRHGDDERQVHLPLAADIARTSAELLFGDTPNLEWSNPTAQDTWDDMSQRLGWSNSLLEGGEVDSALGGVYLRPQWDTDTADHPLSTMVRADEAIPTFRFGVLVSVTFVTELDTDDKTAVWRWLEHHESGQIRHELWKGTNTTIGQPKTLLDHPVTAPLANQLGADGVINTTSIRKTGLLVDYVPNDLPQPLARLPFGRADIQGNETQLDMLDDTWASWMRDLDLGRGRLVVPAEFLEPIAGTPRANNFLGRWRGNTNAAKTFNEDARVYSPLNIPGDDQGKPATITNVQFNIRVDEHQKTAVELVEQIVSRAGYAPQTFGMHVEGQLSGTAINRRERRSTVTRNRKRRYWRPALERYAETLMLINREVFKVKGDVVRPKLDWAADQADPLETAQTIELLARASAVSTEIKVRMAHPEWDDIQVGEELARIKAEQPVAPALTGYEPPVDEQV